VADQSFGFRENHRYGNICGPLDGAQMHQGNAYVMVTGAHRGGGTPAKLGFSMQSLIVFVK
jgi:hypothetical protein